MALTQSRADALTAVSQLLDAKRDGVTNAHCLQILVSAVRQADASHAGRALDGLLRALTPDGTACSAWHRIHAFAHDMRDAATLALALELLEELVSRDVSLQLVHGRFLVSCAAKACASETSTWDAARNECFRHLGTPDAHPARR